MPSPTVRRPPVATAAHVNGAGYNFGDLNSYSQGFLLPEGDYAIEHNVLLHSNTKADGTKGIERLVVMLTAYPIDAAGALIGAPIQHPLSMGSKAHLSFMPNPDTGKGLVPIPGAPAGSLAGMSNWGLYLKSLYDSGLPQGTFTNDISVLDGVWVHTENQPEPEERKSFGAANTGEAAMLGQPQRTGPQMIPVVTEIKEDGKPWEGTGGVPLEEAPPAAAPVAARGRLATAAPKAVAKPAAPARPVAAAARPAAPVRRAAQAPPPPPVEEPAEEVDELAQLALNAAGAILGEKPAGIPRLMLKTSMFKELGGAKDPNAQAVIDTFFADDASLNSIVEQLGFSVNGAQVSPTA